jgi:hypothetical protein
LPPAMRDRLRFSDLFPNKKSLSHNKDQMHRAGIEPATQ